MDNQHKHIKGYRDLTGNEIALMNEGKELAEKVGAFIAKLDAIGKGEEGDAEIQPDGRWVAIARTQLQQGFMALTRAIAQPTTF